MLPMFAQHFADVSFSKGTEIRVAMSRDGTVRTIVDKVEV